MQVYDVGAILLYSLGLEVPSDFEGRVPESVFTPEQLAAKPVTTGSATDSHAPVDGAGAMLPDEKEKIMGQLQMLGYME
jgi:hypothetical protein